MFASVTTQIHFRSKEEWAKLSPTYKPVWYYLDTCLVVQDEALIERLDNLYMWYCYDR